jgi:D-arabinose 1-dehydrogenase-like Zn-dependent alcohol dehydrogenase
MKMRAAQMYGYQQPLRVEEIAVPDVGPASAHSAAQRALTAFDALP